jgi:hypothetical protein
VPGLGYYVALFKSAFGRKPETSKASAIPKTIKQTKKNPATQKKVVTKAEITPAKVNVAASKSSFLNDSNLEKMKFTEFHQKSKTLLDAADVIRPIVIHLINEKAWTKVGMNYAWDAKAYGIATRNNEAVNPEVEGESYINPSQLFNSRSTFLRKGEEISNKLSYAKFTDKRTFNDWSSKKGDSSLNPLSVRDTKRTLLGFYNDLEVRKQDGFVFLFHADSPDKHFAEAKEINKNIQKKEDITLEDLNVMAQYYFTAADIEKKSKTKVAAKGPKGRRRRARRSGSTAAAKYNIKKAPSDRWIGGYQNKLKSFYDKNAATKELASNYEAGKLTDGRYGYRTHYVTIKAAENIISQLDKFLKPKATAKPAATPAPAAVKERRINQLSKLLETKLVGSELNLFNEQDTPAPDAEKRKKLKALLEKLQQIKGRLAAAHSENSRPETDKEILGNDLLEFNKILSVLSWNEKGEIDFNEVYKKMQPEVAATKEPATEREKVAQVARTIRGTCWFDFDPTAGGIRSGTPIEIWAAAGANFEEWYKQIVALFDYEGASPQFNYKSGAAAQGRLKGAPSKLNDNKTQSISLDCLSVFMTKIADNFRRNGGIATKLLLQAKETNDSAKIKKVSDGAKYFLKGDTYRGSVAHGLEQVLNKVIAIIPSFKEGQIQKALETLADKNASDEAKQAAREVIARARRNEKAVTANAQRAQTRAATKPAGAAAKPTAAGAAGAAVAAKGAPAGAKPATTTVNAGDAQRVANAIIKYAKAMADKGQDEQAKEYVRGLVADGATRKDYLTKNRKVSPQLLDAALDYIKTDPAGKAQLGRAVFPNDQAAAPAPTTNAEQGTTKDNPFPSLKVLKNFLKSIERKKLANRSFFVKWKDGTYRFTYDEKGTARGPSVKVQESLKQKREKLLHEALFKKLVR